MALRDASKANCFHHTGKSWLFGIMQPMQRRSEADGFGLSPAPLCVADSAAETLWQDEKQGVVRGTPHCSC